MNNWTQGDIVRLNSGGPDMTIEAIANDGTLSCSWLARGERSFACFAPETVILAA